MNIGHHAREASPGMGYGSPTDHILLYVPECASLRIIKVHVCLNHPLKLGNSCCMLGPPWNHFAPCWHSHVIIIANYKCCDRETGNGTANFWLCHCTKINLRGLIFQTRPPDPPHGIAFWLFDVTVYVYSYMIDVVLL